MSNKKSQPQVSPIMNAMIGGITGAIEVTITYPTEYTKTVMQLYPDINKGGAIKLAKDTMRDRGFFGLYRGYSALLLFTAPKTFTRFGVFHFSK